MKSGWPEERNSFPHLTCNLKHLWRIISRTGIIIVVSTTNHQGGRLLEIDVNSIIVNGMKAKNERNEICKTMPKSVIREPERP
jgi:hypothetical protein